MERIASFSIDHLDHPAGIYLSRQDGDVYTYDVRICKPYADPLLSNAELHSLEHVLATVLRNGPKRDKVVYVGPMGCQTGFYVLYRDLPLQDATADIIAGFEAVAAYDGEMSGGKQAECGNFFNLSVKAAADSAALFLKRIGRR